MTITQGHRLYPTDKDKIFETMKLIDYFKLSSGEFIICTPNYYDEVKKLLNECNININIIMS